MDIIEIIGIIGAVLLIVAWLPEIIEIIKTKKSKLNKRFSELLWISTIILLAYSLMVKDLIFTLINGFLLAEISISVYYSFR